MKRFPYVSIILENMEGEVLLLLRENQSTTIYPNQWTLLGGRVESGEVPERAAQRVLEEETGVKTQVLLWRHYDREHPLLTIDQYIFMAQVEDSGQLLVLGRDTQFFKPCEIEYLKIGYGFKELLQEYFLVKDR
jgi:ADP-ribose pyrophosphatase YjhB (NUDIX family)